MVEASGVRTRPLRQPRDWGYQRLAAGSAVLVMDAAPPPVGRVVEGGLTDQVLDDPQHPYTQLLVSSVLQA